MAASAAQIRAFVAEFGVTAPEPGALKATLRTLFTSRIAGDGIVIVGSAAEAEVIFSGSYTQLGKSFSLDTAAKLPSGRVLALAFDQGEGEEALLPSLGRVSGKLKAETVRAYPPAEAAPLSAKQADPAEHPLVPTKHDWLSQRIVGEFRALAPGKTIAGGREFFAVGDHAIRLYRQDAQLTLLAEATTDVGEKVLAVDTVGPDRDGKLRAYVSIFKGGAASSRVYCFENGTLKVIAKDLPYLFRAIALYGGESRIYAQEIGREQDFYGVVYQVADTGAGIELKNPLELPRTADLFNFNLLRDSAGNTLFVVLGESDDLILYSDARKELWRSSEKFGGSETFFQRHDRYNEIYMGAPLTRFLEQRITVTQQGEIIVPQNVGSFAIGNLRSYAKSSMVSLAWNGSSLEERGRTKLSNTYLADYFFEPQSGNLVLLEVTQKEGIISSGASVIRVIQHDNWAAPAGN